MEGRCTCASLRYRLLDRPLFTHCCHCSWCQRETGSAFALNAMIETEKLIITAGAPEWVTLPTASGKGQQVARCPACRVALFSHYAGGAGLIAFVRVGTLDDPAACPPDIHIYTSTKLPWVVLPPQARVCAEYYQRSVEWPAESLARRAALLARHAAPQQGRH